MNNNTEINQNTKFLYVGFYSIDVDANRLICENGEDFSGLMINPEILLSLGINRKDVVYLNEHGYWKRLPDSMDKDPCLVGRGRVIDNKHILYKTPININTL